MILKAYDRVMQHMEGLSEKSFANKTHLLLVSISRHLYLSRGGVLKYQEKPMEVNAGNFHRSKKDHLAYYVLQDAFSGNYIFSVATTKKMLPLLEFLHFGWRKKKDEEHFWGLPQRVSVPKLISSSELLAGLQQLGVEPFHPSSGFSSGVRVIKDIEDNLCYFVLSRSALHSFATVQRCKRNIYRYMLEGAGKVNRIALWRNSLQPGHPRDLPDYPQFTAFFPVPDEDKPGVPLFGTLTEDEAAEAKPGLADFMEFSLESKKLSPEKLEQAQELLYAAYDAHYRDTALQGAYEALNRSPYCTDAYNLLGYKSRYLDEKIALFRRAVRAGELSLGELFFKRNEGHFWSIFETRPYMRALHGLADALWEKGQHEEAFGIYEEMLRLNPGDNQGIRYLLGFCLIEEKRYDDMEKLYRDHGEDSCFMLYNLALSRFCRNSGSADNVLRRALRANEYVPACLLGEEEVPYPLPDHYSHGSKEEAEIYAGETRVAWRKAAGALDWLQKNRFIMQNET